MFIDTLLGFKINPVNKMILDKKRTYIHRARREPSMYQRLSAHISSVDIPVGKLDLSDLGSF